jgi:hypothetical protein
VRGKHGLRTWNVPVSAVYGAPGAKADVGRPATPSRMTGPQWGRNTSVAVNTVNREWAGRSALLNSLNDYHGLDVFLEAPLLPRTSATRFRICPVQRGARRSSPVS